MAATKTYYAENKFDPKDRFHQESVKTSILFAPSGSKLLNHLRRILSLKNPTEVHMIEEVIWIKLTYDQIGEDLRLSRDTIYRKIKEFQKYELLEFKKVEGFTGLLIRINEEVRLKLLEITSGIRSTRCREKIKKIRLSVWQTFAGWLSRRAAQMAEFAEKSVRIIRTLRTKNSDDTPYILNTRDLEEERRDLDVSPKEEFLSFSSFNTDKLQEQPIQLPVVSISEIGAKVTDDFTKSPEGSPQDALKSPPALSRQEEEGSPTQDEAPKAAVPNTSVTDFGIQYMAHSWNMVAKELEIDNALKNIDSLSQKTLDHAKLTWDKFGRDGWEKVLEMYQLSAYLQGKTDANGHTAFTFASIVDPARAEVIYSGKYTGGITVAKRDGEEHVTTLAELIFEGGFAEEKRIVADRITAACYRSWIVDPGVQFRVVGNTLYLGCSPFTFDKLELKFKDVLLEAFGCGRLERGS